MRSGGSGHVGRSEAARRGNDGGARFGDRRFMRAAVGISRSALALCRCIGGIDVAKPIGPIGRMPPVGESPAYPMPIVHRNEWPENYEPYAGLSYESVRRLLSHLGDMPPLLRDRND